MRTEDIDEAVKEIAEWMAEARHGALRAEEVRCVMMYVKALAKAAKKRGV